MTKLVRSSLKTLLTKSSVLGENIEILRNPPEKSGWPENRGQTRTTLPAHLWISPEPRCSWPLRHKGSLPCREADVIGGRVASTCL